MNNDITLENYSKMADAQEHFSLLNNELEEMGAPVRYSFNILSPSSYPDFDTNNRVSNLYRNAVPAIIPWEVWNKVQEIIRINSEGKVKSQNNQPCHRYASLLDKILSEKELSHTKLRLLIEKTIIYEDEYELRLEILMKAAFLEKSYTDEIGMICEDNYEEVSNLKRELFRFSLTNSQNRK